MLYPQMEQKKGGATVFWVSHHHCGPRNEDPNHSPCSEGQKHLG